MQKLFLKMHHACALIFINFVPRFSNTKFINLQAHELRGEHLHVGVALLLLALVFKILLLLNDGSKLRNPDYFRTMSRGRWKSDDIFRTMSRGRWKIKISHPKNDVFRTMNRGCWKISKMTGSK